MDPMQDKIFDKSIRTKVQAFEPKVPEGIWADIAVSLEEKPVASLKQEKNRFFWLRMAAAIIVLIGAGTFYMNRPREIIYLTANGKKEDIKTIVSSVETTTGQKPLEQGSVNGAEQITRKSFVGQRKASSERAEQQALVAATEETNLIASAPAFAHPVLSEEVKRPELNVLDSGTHEEKLVNVFIDEQPGLIILAQEPSKDKKRFGAGNLLNYVVKAVDQRDQKVLSFANDEEGTIKVALNLKALKIKL